VIARLANLILAVLALAQALPALYIIVRQLRNGCYKTTSRQPKTSQFTLLHPTLNEGDMLVAITPRKLFCFMVSIVQHRLLLIRTLKGALVGEVLVL